MSNVCLIIQYNNTILLILISIQSNVMTIENTMTVSKYKCNAMCEM